MIRSQQRHADDEVDVPLHMLEDLGIEFEFEMDTESMSRAYFECAAEGNVETLRFLLSSDVHGELLNSVDVDGFSALMIAADTPLVWACIEGRDAAVAVLLRHGADPRVTNHYGATTLMCATMIGEDTDDATDMARKVIEAEQTGCDGSDACVAFLKVHWAKLEDEVNKRMRTMLELEDDSSVATPGKAAKKKKKHKKNNHAAKKKLPPPSTTKMSTAPSSPKADEDESSDDGASSNMPSAPISSLTWQAHIQPVSSSAPPSRNGWWSDRHYRKGAAVPLRPANLLGWLQHLDTNVRDALAMLACGTCGDWVHDNLQLACCDPSTLQHNVVAQQQAACVGLVQGDGSTATTTKSLAALEDDMHAAVPLARHVALSPVGLVPGQTEYLASCSMAQLDVLEEMHYTALRQLQEARVTSVRAHERMRYDQELKQQLYLHQSLVTPVSTVFASHDDDRLVG
ncbi:hypothetical protein DYB36_001220 [Aphanomyces astaci]|uniref:Uncharacterized protein n=1 Tax=Aphanomyces astaci TaxID=112090 RepID=A0A397A3I4_APHAT|nr:hypothetical protein DYB36_001220 [Aphanomyces astaci]